MDATPRKPAACLLGLTAAALLAGAGPAAGERRYEVTLLDRLPNTIGSQPVDINDDGLVLLSAVNDRWEERPWLWDSANGYRALPYVPGGGDDATATALSNTGQVCGDGKVVAGTMAFLWDAENGMQPLGDFPGGFTESWAYGLNNNGQVVGRGTTGGGHVPFVWSEATGLVNANDLRAPGETLSLVRALDINDAGQIVGSSGSRPALRLNVDGTVTDLGDLPGGYDHGGPGAINSDGLVCGWSYGTDGSTRAFLWDPAYVHPDDLDCHMRDLGSLPGEGESSYAHDVNDAGHVVGDSDVDGTTHAFLWTLEEGMQDLNDLIIWDNDEILLELHTAVAINEAGQILCNAAGEVAVLTPAGPPPHPGDVNNDGAVDIFDAFLLNSAWDSAEGDPRFDPDADFNDDGFVNIFDAVYVNNAWGWQAEGVPAPAPEPVSCSLLIAGWLLLAGARGKRSAAATRRPSRPRLNRRDAIHAQATIRLRP